jgi:hypothetical protein
MIKRLIAYARDTFRDSDIDNAEIKRSWFIKRFDSD